MGISRRPYDNAAFRAKAEASRADHAAGLAAVEAWNEAINAGRKAWSVPRIGAALLSDHPWLTVRCPGCRTETELIDAALATQPITPTESAPDRRRRFRVIEGGKIAE